jgi:uncharacterized protein (UPF0548 family)
MASQLISHSWRVTKNFALRVLIAGAVVVYAVVVVEGIAIIRSTGVGQ